MRGEVQEREIFGSAAKIGGGNCTLLREFGALGRREIFFEHANLAGGLWEGRKIRVSGQRITDEEQVGLLRPCGCRATGKERQGVGGPQGDVVNPIVALRLIHDERFEVEPVQAAIGKNNDA